MITVGSWAFEDEEDALAFHEEKLFEVKQHLQSKPLLRATVKSRISLLNQLTELERELGIEEGQSGFPIPDFSGKNAVEQWNLFSVTASNWKLKVYQAEAARELLVLIESGFVYLKRFYELLPDMDWQEEDPKVGVGENVMHLQAGMDWMKSNGINDFSSLKNHPFGENGMLKLFYLELKRLSLRLPYL